MADAGPPQAADTPSASPEVGPDPLDADTLRNLQRLLDDGEIDADEFERRKAEALGLRRRSRPRGRSRGCRRKCYKTCSASSS